MHTQHAILTHRAGTVASARQAPSTPDPTVIAAQQTAFYTLVLAIATFLLFFVTVAALFIGEMQRKAGTAQTEKARESQFRHDKELSDAAMVDSQRDRDQREQHRRADDEFKRAAGLAQLVTILRSYERALSILVEDQNYPIAPYARTMEVLFAHALSEGVASAVPTGLRSMTLMAVVAAQEALHQAVKNQRWYELDMHALETDMIASARFTERLAAATSEVHGVEETLRSCFEPVQQNVLQERLIEARHRLTELNTSKDAYDARRYDSTRELRTTKLNSLLPAIKTDAERAITGLVTARTKLGDDARAGSATLK